MPLLTRRSQWLLSALLFGAILVALTLAAILLDPVGANLPH